MELDLYTAPSSEPVTLTEAKLQCREVTTDNDTYLTALIVAARDYVERHTGRALMPQTWDVRYDSQWPTERVQGAEIPRIIVPRPPLTSVTSIKYLDASGVEQTLAADQYRVDTKRFRGVIDPAYGVTWPTVYPVVGAITVRFVAGYANAAAVPASIRHAMLLLIGHWFANRETVVIGTLNTPLTFAVEELLFPHRVFYG